jgi:Ca2+-binding EF-hand superfamily protein
MLNKCQIVPELAAAVHGVTEELPLIPDSPSPEFHRSRLESTTSSTSSSNNFHIPVSSSNSRTISQINARNAFAYFDKNHDGKLSIKEFKSVMHDLGYKTIDKRSIRQIFAEANRNGKSQTLSYNEFVEFLETKLSLSTTTTEDLNVSSLPTMEIDIETLFNCYDLDKNGFIEPKELRKVMKRLTGEKLSKQDIEEMINVADKNGDGLLDKTEFALLLRAF